MASNGRDSVRSKTTINNNTVKETNTSKLSRLLHFTKVNIRPRIGREDRAGEEKYKFTLSPTSALQGVGVSGGSVPRPGRFTTQKDLVPFVKGAKVRHMAGMDWCTQSRPYWDSIPEPQPVADGYTELAIPAHIFISYQNVPHKGPLTTHHRHLLG